jgi:hypothetical protein
MFNRVIAAAIAEMRNSGLVSRIIPTREYLVMETPAMEIRIFRVQGMNLPGMLNAHVCLNRCSLVFNNVMNRDSSDRKVRLLPVIAVLPIQEGEAPGESIIQVEEEEDKV